MDAQIEKFAQPIGREAARCSVDSYKKSTTTFQDGFEVPMHYASGFTTALLAHAFAKEWIIPLRRRARLAILAAAMAMVFLLVAIIYSWSIMDFDTFSRFLVAFVPAIVALIYSITKAYKTWAEAKRTLAEARKLEREANLETKELAAQRRP